MKKLKQLLSNKNTVTFIAAILIVLVLYFFYNWRVDQAISPVTVPYAIQTIEPRTKITDDMIGWMEISQGSVKGNILTDKKALIDHYTNVNSVIPGGSLFYSSQVVTQEELPDSFLVDVPEGFVPFNFSVNVESTYGNSMYPGNYVDVYFKGVDQSGLIMVGKLIENVNILAVKDSSGRHVFESANEERTPSQIIFAVTEDIHLLLRKAGYIKNAELILVPTTASLETDQETTINVTSATIRNYIEEQSAVLDAE